MSMSKKDYEIVAETINLEYRKHSPDDADGLGARFAVRHLAVALSMKFEADNPRFDAQRFYDACTKTPR